MANKHRTNKAQLNKRWREVNDALTGVGDLRVWPVGQDIAELDELEYKAGRELS